MATIEEPWPEFMKLSELIEAVTAWAQDREDIVGLTLIGSHARGEARPDSDVDFTILSENARLLVDDLEWTQRFGNPRSVSTEQHGVTVSVRVFYQNSWEVEFGIASPSWARVPLDPGTRRVVSDGMRILYDPKGLYGAAKEAAGRPGL